MTVYSTFGLKCLYVETAANAAMLIQLLQLSEGLVMTVRDH